MLGKYYRLRVLNSTDQILTYVDGARVNLRMSPWKLVSGALSYGTSIVQSVLTTGTIAIDASLEGAVVDNTSNLYWGINGFLEIIADADSTDGTVYLYLEISDDNTNWPSDGADFDIEKHMRLISTINLSTTAVDQDASTNFIIE